MPIKIDKEAQRSLRKMNIWCCILSIILAFTCIFESQRNDQTDTQKPEEEPSEWLYNLGNWT